MKMFSAKSIAFCVWALVLMATNSWKDFLVAEYDKNQSISAVKEQLLTFGIGIKILCYI